MIWITFNYWKGVPFLGFLMLLLRGFSDILIQSTYNMTCVRYMYNQVSYQRRIRALLLIGPKIKQSSKFKEIPSHCSDDGDVYLYFFRWWWCVFVFVQMMVVVAINTASVVAVLPYSYHMQVPIKLISISKWSKKAGRDYQSGIGVCKWYIHKTFLAMPVALVSTPLSE